MFIPMKSNSGSKARTACMTACAIARVAVLGFWSVCLLSSAAGAADIDVPRILKGVEDRYNRTQTLQLSFTESYQQGARTRVEKGDLFLRKPGRMLWQYSTPAGKIFLLDGKYAWLYTKGDAQIQRVPAKELDDLRSPLRFLLGHTQLEKELSGLKLEGAANGLYRLSGMPKGQENSVTRLELTVTAAGAISSLEVQEVDGATTRFTFTGEQPDAAIPAEMFHFTPPAGVPVVDAMPPV